MTDLLTVIKKNEFHDKKCHKSKTMFQIGSQTCLRE